MTTKYASPGISPRTNVYAEAMLLAHAQPVLVLEKTGLPKRMPQNKTDTIKFRRPVPFAAQTTPLVEGVTPTASSFYYEDVTATLKQYGQVVQVTDKIEDTHEDPVLQDMMEQLGENVGRTIEALNYAIVRAGTNVFYANGASRAVVNTPISVSKQRAVIRALKAQKARKFTKILDSSPKWGTRAIEASYIAVCHSDLESDIRDMPGFVPTSEYGQRSVICDEELGSVEDVRYLCSPDLEPWIGDGSATTNGMMNDGSNVNVYPVMFFGKESWAHVALRGKGAVSPTVIPPGQITKDDPLGQRGVAGWKTWHSAVILNQLWMARLEVGATEL